MREWLLVLKAADAAARWHVHQRRKGSAEEPYINHLVEVAMLVAGDGAAIFAHACRLGDGFIALIRMMIAPVIFCTIVHGIASTGDLKKVGRVGIKTRHQLALVPIPKTLALFVSSGL
jgi:Sodium:dicarboxylate symporter family